MLRPFTFGRTAQHNFQCLAQHIEMNNASFILDFGNEAQDKHLSCYLSAFNDYGPDSRIQHLRFGRQVVSRIAEVMNDRCFGGLDVGRLLHFNSIFLSEVNEFLR